MSFEVRRVEGLGAWQVEIGRSRVTVEAEPTYARFERRTYLVLHRQAVDGTWQRAVDVLDPPRAAPLVPHPQGAKK